MSQSFSERDILALAIPVLQKHNAFGRPLTYDSGPYEVTTPSALLRDLMLAALEHADSTLRAENERLAREVEALRGALTKIAELHPDNDSDEGCNEWGEADCFVKAQRVARAAIASAPQEAPK